MARNGQPAGEAGEPEPERPPASESRPAEEPPAVARNTNPNALRLPDLVSRASELVDQEIAAQRRSGTPGGRTGIPQAPIQSDPNFSTEEPTILSDTRGYDFGPYMNQVVNRVRINWYSLIPEVARLGRRGRVVIVFTITEDGSVRNIRMAANSGTDPLDRAAYGAIAASNPFPQLPPNFDGNHIDLQFTFLYNIR
jgi:TonB family protein